MKTRIVGLGCTGLLLCAGASARADPISITSGQIVAATTESEYTFISDIAGEFNVSGMLNTSPGYASFFGPRPAGESMPFVLGLNGPGQWSNGTIHGTFYPSFVPGGIMQAIAQPVTMPPAPAGTFRSFDTPFTFFGVYAAYPPGTTDTSTIGGLNPAEFFASRVSGQGTATLYAQASESSGGNGSTTAWNVRIALFNFAPSPPSPTPEPATLLMVASGLVVACRGYSGSDRRP